MQIMVKISCFCFFVLAVLFLFQRVYGKHVKTHDVSDVMDFNFPVKGPSLYKSNIFHFH